MSRKNEIAILLQYTFVATYMTIIIILWHKGGPEQVGYTESVLFPDNWFDMTNPRSQAMINVFWIACAYLSPVMLLILNMCARNSQPIQILNVCSPIRQEFLVLLGFEMSKERNRNRLTTSMWSAA